MITGLTGSLLSHDALTNMESQADGHALVRALRTWHADVTKDIGPASSARIVFDRLAAPLLHRLGFRVIPMGDRVGTCLYAQLATERHTAAVLVATDWGRDPSTVWRDTVRLGIGNTVRWCFCVTGPLLRIVDATRTYSRRYAQFDIDLVMQDPAALSTLVGLIQASAFATPPGALDLAVIASERYRAEVRASLQDGVLEALQALLSAFAHARRRRPASNDVLLDESLVVVYRVLFLLFAEARGLVPKWHRVFRDSYTIESLRPAVERQDHPRGLWESLQAIARLAHDGCHAGSLRVPAFNGRLFSPLHAPMADALSLDDGAVRRAMLALTTRNVARGRRRIAYADLGVEQLGGVYERILDFSPAVVHGVQEVRLVRTGRRKTTGTFYTPRSLTEFVVRRTLAPLVADASAARILALRIVDPAMGSGAFLVAACRYLATAYESALVREGIVSMCDVTESDRAGFRRVVAQRCLFGVDVNPMAVQLGRLSLWLTTLAGDRPLTFLDHHLRPGNSLVGTTLEDVAHGAPSCHRRRTAVLPLFDVDDADRAFGSVVGPRRSLGEDPGDTLVQVRAKERLLLSLQHDGPLARWKTVADLWCAEWFRDARAITPAIFRAVVDCVLLRPSTLPDHMTRSILDHARAIANCQRFFHWPLEFPEVFYEDDGRPRERPGFDAVLGNPPWEVLRGDRGPSTHSSRLTGFARASGIYRHQGEGHANLYQLFTERALSLVREGGRLGLVLPSGFAVDHGCAALRRALLDRTALDTFVTIENRDGVFPIHRGLKFVLVAATSGRPTASVPSRVGVRSPDVLDRLADTGETPGVTIPRGLIDRLSGGQCAIPELRTAQDLSILSRIAFSIPALKGDDGWNVAFGRELNATDDREHFMTRSPSAGDCAIVEGKQVAPFTVDLAATRFAIRESDASRLVGTSWTRARLAYRDVASASNRLTLIAAVLPARVVSTHTLFCVKADVDSDIQHFLCGIFNSFVANYLVRMRVSTHVTVAIVEQLRVPRPSRDSHAFAEVVRLSRALTASPSDRVAAARLQALVAALYGCSHRELEHVLESFPLVPADERAAALAQLADVRLAMPSS